MIKRLLFYSFLLFFSISWETTSQDTFNQEVFIKGADMSLLPLIESEGKQYYIANNQSEDALVILKKAGCNTIRIRIWKN